MIRTCHGMYLASTKLEYANSNRIRSVRDMAVVPGVGMQNDLLRFPLAQSEHVFRIVPRAARSVCQMMYPIMPW